MRSFDLRFIGSTALVAVFAFAAAGDANAQKNRGKNAHAGRGNNAKAVKMQRGGRDRGRADNAGRHAQRPAAKAGNSRGGDRRQTYRAARQQPQRAIRVAHQPQRGNSGKWNAQRGDRSGRGVRIYDDRRGNDRSYRQARRPQVIVPPQKRYPQRYRTQRRDERRNAVWYNGRDRGRRDNYYEPIRNSRVYRTRDRYERRSSSYYGRPTRVRTGRSWGMYNRRQNLLASYYRKEQHNRWKAYKREQKQRERYWREVRKNERRYQRYLARVYRDRYYSQPYYYQPYTTVRYGYMTPRRAYYAGAYTVYNNYPSGYYYPDNGYYDPYYQQSYYDPYYYDNDNDINWTAIILQTALSAFLPDSGFDSIIPVDNYGYDPGYDYAPANYVSYSPTVYSASPIESAYRRGYQEGFAAGQNSAYYNDPYVMQNGGYYPYSVSLNQQRELLSEGYERGYADAMNGSGGYYYDDGYAGSGDLVGILLDNVLTLS